MSSLKRSIIVVADTHFGLKKDKQNCDPIAFSDFLNWVKSLEEKGNDRLNLGIWGTNRKHLDLYPPEKMIFLGDILELWDASKNAIDVSTRSLIQSISDLTCDKIYVLGNHDYDLLEVKGKYPFGLSNIDIIDESCVLQKGDEQYVFLHGHQFDKYFTLPSWKVMPHIKTAAMVFGEYTWILFALFVANLIFTIRYGVSSVTDVTLPILLGLLSIPFLIIKFGRNVWNNLRSVRYKPEPAADHVEKWWKKYGKKRKITGENYNIVYGHTHEIDYWVRQVDSQLLTLLNIPSWVIDTTEKNGISLENVFRHAFLYVDEEGSQFVSWDTEKKRPFLIPKEIIQTRQVEGEIYQVNLDDPKLKEYGMADFLKEIDWPQKLIDKWIQ